MERPDNWRIILKQTRFLPLHGAYKAIPADFDLDGDIDIAAISFFPDYKQDQPTDFVIFEQNKNEMFPKTINLKNTGRWLTFDAGDIDQDGGLDLVLGSLTFEVPGQPMLVGQWVQNGLLFVILENQSK